MSENLGPQTGRESRFLCRDIRLLTAETLKNAFESKKKFTMFFFLFKALFYMKTSNNIGPQIGRESSFFGRELIFVLNTLKKLIFDDN